MPEGSDSLVIVVSVWRGDGSVRARVSYDDGGRSEVVCGSVPALLATVERVVGGWDQRTGGDGS